MSHNQPPTPPSQTTPSASSTPPPGSRPSQPSLGELVARISENVSGLVRGEIDLAKAKGQRMAQKMGVGIGLLVGAGVLGLYAFGLLLGAAVNGLDAVLPLWASYLIVGVVLIIIAAVLAAVGRKRLQAAKADTPDPKAGLRNSVDAVKGAVTAGLERGNAQ